MKRRYTVRYLPAAEQDFLGIVDYIARDNPSAARRFVDRLDHAIGRLALFPRSGRRPIDPRLRKLAYRILVVGDHLVFYVVVKRVVQVRRVLHGARRYDFLLDPED